MNAANVLAGVAVTDLDTAQPWYEKLLGSAGNRPMPEVAEWSFPQGGGLQVFADQQRAGASSITLVVDDLDQQVGRLQSDGHKVHSRTDSEYVKTAQVEDPAGNRIVLAQAKTHHLVR